MSEDAREGSIPPGQRLYDRPFLLLVAGERAAAGGAGGAVIHRARVYILDDRGRVAFTATGGGAYAVELLRRL